MSGGNTGIWGDIFIPGGGIPGAGGYMFIGNSDLKMSVFFCNSAIQIGNK